LKSGRTYKYKKKEKKKPITVPVGKTFITWEKGKEKTMFSSTTKFGAPR
jgi:hypothetical protein